MAGYWGWMMFKVPSSVSHPMTVIPQNISGMILFAPNRTKSWRCCILVLCGQEPSLIAVISVLHGVFAALGDHNQMEVWWKHAHVASAGFVYSELSPQLLVPPAEQGFPVMLSQ